MSKFFLFFFGFTFSVYAFGQTKKLHRNVSNGLDEEVAPKISADGNSLVFLYKPHIGGGWKIYYSRKKSGNWGRAFELPNVNKQSNLIQFGGFSLNEDGSVIYFSSKKYGGVGGFDLWQSTRVTDQEWTEPVNLFKPINSVGNECSPSISADGNYMYFTRSDNMNAVGSSCGDIYVAKRRGKSWSEAVVLPSPINTGCESSPFIHPDGKTLYFSSSRKGGKGKLDLYLSKNVDGDSWSKPLALAFLNTIDDDLYITMDAREHIMYYDGKKGKTSDLYATIIDEKYRAEPLLKIRLRLKDEEGNRVVGYLRIKHPGSGTNLFVKKIKSDAYQTNLYVSGKGDHDFTIYGVDDDHYFFSEEFNMDSLERYRYIKREIVIQTLVKDGVYPVHLSFNQDSLLSAFGKEELERIKRVVSKHSDKNFILEVKTGVFETELISDTVNSIDSTGIRQVVRKEVVSIEENLITQKIVKIQAYCNSIGLTKRRLLIVRKEVEVIDDVQFSLLMH